MHGLRAFELQGKRFTASSRTFFRIRGSVVPNRENQSAIFSTREQGRIGIDGDSLITKLMQQLKNCEGRLRNIVDCDQAEATVEWRLHYSLFFEYIGERPVRHHV